MDDEALHDIAAGCQYRPEEYAVMARELLALRRADAVKQALIEAATRWRYAAAHVTVHAVGGHDQLIEDEYSGAACALCRALDRAANHASPAPAEAAAPMREGGAELTMEECAADIIGMWDRNDVGVGDITMQVNLAAEFRRLEAHVRAECEAERERLLAMNARRVELVRETDDALAKAEAEVERLNGYVQRLTTQRDAARRERDAATAQQTQAAGEPLEGGDKRHRLLMRACEDLDAFHANEVGPLVPIESIAAYLATRPDAAGAL